VTIAGLLFLGRQVAVAFHAVQQWVERARTDLVAVMGQFLDHPVAVDRLLGGMVQHMEPDEAGKKFLVFETHSENRYRISSILAGQ
jgi:hypothetical protein